MRAFLALELSSGARDAIATIQTRWKAVLSSARWIRPENLHLTLRFLGNVDPGIVSSLAEALRPVTRAVAPFAYSLRGGGCFPSPKRARVLWVGVEPVPEEMVRLHHSAEKVAQQQGLAAEERGFKPHLTIARLKSPDAAVADVVSSLEAEAFGDTAVSELVLFESRLSPRGATYRAIERFPLGRTKREQLV